jgi:hypothetical protein
MPVTLETTASRSSAGRSRFRWISALLLPLCVLALAEAGARGWSAREKRWYDRAAVQLSRGPVGALFIGSSRVAAAIDENAWNAAASETAINLGQGFSTYQEHYFGLRDLIAQYPERFRGAAIFIEAPRGMPDPSTWQDPWVHPESPRMLVPVLRVGDLPGVWSAPLTFETKSRITFGFVLRPSALFTQKDRLGSGFLLLGEDFFARKLAGVKPAPGNGDLTGAGGIRTDPESVKRARITAVRMANEDIQSQRPVAAWDRTVMHDIVRLAQQAGARPIFFEMPVCSVQSSVFDTAIRRRDRQTFFESAKRWGTPIVRTTIVLTDEDFPDLWHLRKSRAAAFTQALAEAARNRRPASSYHVL